MIPLGIILFYINSYVFVRNQSKRKKLAYLQFTLRYFFYFGLLLLLFNPLIKIKKSSLNNKSNFIFFDNSRSIFQADSTVKKTVDEIFNKSELSLVYSQNSKKLMRTDSLLFNNNSTSFNFTQNDFKNKFDKFYLFSDLNFSSNSDLRNLVEFSDKFPEDSRYLIYPENKRNIGIDLKLSSVRVFSINGNINAILNLDKTNLFTDLPVKIMVENSDRKLHFDEQLDKDSEFQNITLKLPDDFKTDSLKFEVKGNISENNLENNYKIYLDKKKFVFSPILFFYEKPSYNIRFLKLFLDNESLDYETTRSISRINKPENFTLLICNSKLKDFNSEEISILSKFKKIIIVPENPEDFKIVNKIINQNFFRRPFLIQKAKPILTDSLLSFLRPVETAAGIPPLNVFSYELPTKTSRISTGIKIESNNRTIKNELVEILRLADTKITVVNIQNIWKILFSKKNNLYKEILVKLFINTLNQNVSENFHLLSPDNSHNLFSEKDYDFKIKVFDDLYNQLGSDVKVSANYNNKKMIFDYDYLTGEFHKKLRFSHEGELSLNFAADGKGFHKAVSYKFTIEKNNFETENYGLNKEASDYLKNVKNFQIIPLSKISEFKQSKAKYYKTEENVISLRTSLLFISFLLLLFFTDIFIAKYKGLE